MFEIIRRNYFTLFNCFKPETVECLKSYLLADDEFLVQGHVVVPKPVTESLLVEGCDIISFLIYMDADSLMTVTEIDDEYMSVATYIDSVEHRHVTEFLVKHWDRTDREQLFNMLIDLCNEWQHVFAGFVNHVVKSVKKHGAPVVHA